LKSGANTLTVAVLTRGTHMQMLICIFNTWADFSFLPLFLLRFFLCLWPAVLLGIVFFLYTATPTKSSSPLFVSLQALRSSYPASPEKDTKE